MNNGTPKNGTPAKNPPPSKDAADAAEDPGIAQVYQHMMFGLSLPERALRSTSALVGGAISESASLLVPQAFRNSKSYEVFVHQMLDFMVHDVGGVHNDDAKDEEAKVEGYVARKAVGSFVDLAGMATLHLSPLTVLAIVSDVAYGSQVYLHELSSELKEAGVIAEDTTIDHAADLLDALSNTSKTTASAFDMPPVSIEGLRETIEQTRAAASELNATKLIPQAEMKQLWTEMHEIAVKEHVSLLDVSSTMSLYTLNKVGQFGQGALSTVKVAGNMFDRHIFDHYRTGLNDIQEKGLYTILAESSGPYISAVWQNFSTEKTTITEDLLSGKLIGRAWGGMNSWWAGKPAEATGDAKEDCNSGDGVGNDDGQSSSIAPKP